MGVRGGAEMDALLSAIVNSVTRPGNGGRPALPSLGQMSTYSYLLPASALSSESRVVDDCVKRALEPRSLINWCSTLKRVQPVCTKGDGNCLLHAVSLSMWGIHDSGYLLRQLVREALEMSTEPIRKRWQSQLEKEHSAVPGGFHLSEQEWQHDWDMVVKLVSDGEVRQQMYNNVDSLEAIHVFVVANVLRRPILVYGEAVVRDVAGHSFSPNNIVGTYLPLLCPASECTRTPILLTFHNGHFVPLLSVADGESEVASGRAVSSLHCAPLVLRSLEQLRVHFLLDDDERRLFELLRRYFDLDDVPFTLTDSILTILCAKLNHIQLPETLRIALPQPPSQVSAASACYWPLPTAQLPVGSVSLSSDGCAAPWQDRTAAGTSGVAGASGGYNSTAAGLLSHGDAADGQRMLAATGHSPGAILTAFSATQDPSTCAPAVPSAPPLTQNLVLSSDTRHSSQNYLGSQRSGNDDGGLDYVAAYDDLPARPAPGLSDGYRYTSISGLPCVTPNCTYYSSINTFPLCHDCKKANSRAKQLDRAVSAVKVTTASNDASSAAVAGLRLTNCTSATVGSGNVRPAGSSSHDSTDNRSSNRIPEQREPPLIRGLPDLVEPSSRQRPGMICSSASCRSQVTKDTYPYCPDCHRERQSASGNLPGISQPCAPPADASDRLSSRVEQQRTSPSPSSPHSRLKSAVRSPSASSTTAAASDAAASGDAAVLGEASSSFRPGSPSHHSSRGAASQRMGSSSADDVFAVNNGTGTSASAVAAAVTTLSASDPEAATRIGSASSENGARQPQSASIDSSGRTINLAATTVAACGVGSRNSREAASAAVPLSAGKCVHPECTDRASVDYGGLCKECYDIICETKRKKRSKIATVKVPLCIHPGCDAVGHSGLNELCQKHFTDSRKE